MKTFSWVYRDINTGRKCLVMRPHRAAVAPNYWIKYREKGPLVLANFTYFHQNYKFVGRLGSKKGHL